MWIAKAWLSIHPPVESPMSLWNSVNLRVALCNKSSVSQRNTEVAQRGAEKNL
jgi:hypothetical protein